MPQDPSRTVFENSLSMAFVRDGKVLLLAKKNMRNGAHVRLESGKTLKLRPMRSGNIRQIPGRPIGVFPLGANGEYNMYGRRDEKSE